MLRLRSLMPFRLMPRAMLAYRVERYFYMPWPRLCAARAFHLPRERHIMLRDIEVYYAIRCYDAADAALDFDAILPPMLRAFSAYADILLPRYASDAATLRRCCAAAEMATPALHAMRH